MSAYYNEFDPYAAEWLRNLIAAGHIAPGDVDERSIEDVRGDDLRGYTQVHLFAGIGGWSLALRMAGWGDDRPVWSGSCPCQPFSVAGKGAGADDPRHLWPHMRRLVAECRPPVVFGEQVASAAVVGKAGGKADGAAGPVWLDGIFADLEAAGYACGAVVLPAAGVGAPHIRQRLWWCAERLADPAGAGGASRVQASGTERATGLGQAGACGGLADAASGRTGENIGGLREGARRACGGEASACRLADRACGGQREHGGAPGQPGHADQRGASERVADATLAGGRDDERGPFGPSGCCSIDRLAAAELRERGQGRLCDGGGPAGADGERAPEELAGGCGDRGLVYPERDGRGPGEPWRKQDRGEAAGGAGADGWFGDACNEGLERRAGQREDYGTQLATAERADSHWGNTWLQCSDGTARRVEPAIPPLAHGLPRSVGDLRAGAPGLGDGAGSVLKEARRFRKGALRGAGNAIVPQVAALFVKAYMDTTEEGPE